jgi:O-methyltransferase involved in polyketide biosynthesis
VDLARESLASALLRSSFDPGAPTFFSWLGVTYYLPRTAVFDTLRAISSLAAPSSTVVFDFVDTDTYDPQKASQRLQRVQAIVRRVGEPMQTGFNPATLASELSPVSLSLREHLSPEQIQARYFDDRTDGYRAIEHFHFAAATVR